MKTKKMKKNRNFFLLEINKVSTLVIRGKLCSFLARPPFDVAFCI